MLSTKQENVINDCMTCWWWVWTKNWNVVLDSRLKFAQLKQFDAGLPAVWQWDFCRVTAMTWSPSPWWFHRETKLSPLEKLDIINSTWGFCPACIVPEFYWRSIALLQPMLILSSSLGLHHPIYSLAGEKYHLKTNISHLISSCFQRLW